VSTAAPDTVARLTPYEADHVLQIAREALANAVRHSRARAGALTLSTTDGGICLEVVDDGTGFDTRNAKPAGFGLHNIRQRAQQLGAQLEVRSSPGKETCLLVQIPRTV
jgi:signal transduction histidine kinase